MRNYTIMLAPHPLPDDGSPFIYRGTYDSSGSPSTLKAARASIMPNWSDVYAVDLDPHCCAPPLRCYVHGVNDASDAHEALYEAARDMGPPADENRTNLFTELYGECNGHEPGCWCEPESKLILDGKHYHENEGAILGICRVTKAEYVHDGGTHKWRERRNARARQTWREMRQKFLDDGIPVKCVSPWRSWRF